MLYHPNHVAISTAEGAVTYGYGRDLTDEVLNTWVSPHTGHQFGLYGLLRTPVGTFYVSPIVADQEIVIPGLAAPLWEGGLEVRRGLTTRASGTGTTARRSRTPIASREPRPTRERRTPAPLRLGDSGFRRRPRARSRRHSSDLSLAHSLAGPPPGPTGRHPRQDRFTCGARFPILSDRLDDRTTLIRAPEVFARVTFMM